MARNHIFHKLVLGENSFTELFCNYMRLADFRELAIARLTSTDVASRISEDDIEPQTGLRGYGRPDLYIKSADLEILVEVKTNADCGCTKNQPEGYLQYLVQRSKKPDRWLVFLVPRDWTHLPETRQKLSELADPRVQTKIVYWNEILSDMRERLDASNPIFGELMNLLAEWFEPKRIAFGPKEISVLYSKETGKAVTSLYGLITKIETMLNKAEFRTRPERNEYGRGFYVRDAKGRYIFWFGVWMEFWAEHGAPLCVAIYDEWETAVPGLTQIFERIFSESVPFRSDKENWIIAAVPEDTLTAKEEPARAVFGLLKPYLDLVMAAKAKGAT
jgi:hypothetical protein